MTRMWEGSLSGNFSLQSGSITDEYRLDYDKLDETLLELLRGVVHSDYANLYVKTVGVSKLGDADSTSGGPNQVKMKVTWETLSGGNGEPPPFIQNDMTAWMENWEATGEAITIGEGFIWKSDASNVAVAIKDADISAVMYFPAASFSLTGRTNLFGAQGKSYILDAQGHTNEKNLSVNGFVYESDHLLFENFSAVEGKDVFGSDIHTLTYNFVYQKSNDWNHYWRKDRLSSGTTVPGFHEVITSDGSTNPYTSVPFSDIDPANW